MHNILSWMVIVTSPAAPRKCKIDKKDKDICNVPYELRLLASIYSNNKSTGHIRNFASMVKDDFK